ncbi:MAG: protein-glutamate O-methyltransferase CheR [Gammaproteobacteria bacterium]|nr:MAG: protein-glutamate O-methyltransferase CheR [Gammaproteobacteria bacterium]
MAEAQYMASGYWELKKLPPMSAEEFDSWQSLLESRTGMTLSPQRKTFLETSLAMRMREVGCDSYTQYYEHVTSGPNRLVEWAILVDRLTVQETRFYRDPAALELVRDYLLTRPAEQLGSRPFEVWSVGCATGEEPYTLAMVIDDCLRSVGMARYYGITGTDISTPALEKARKALYGERRLADLPETLRDRYLERQPNGQWKVSQTLCERVCFARMNVLELRQAPLHGMNLIYCQNLLIYFRRWRRKDIVSRLVERLRPGGLLVLGLGELTDWAHPELERIPSEKVLAFIKKAH